MITFYKTVQSFSQFLWNWVLKGGQLVDQNTANLRGQTCISCHNNLPTNEVRKGCGVCNKMGGAVLNSVRSSIIKKNSSTYDSQLMTCGICGCDLKISVWIPNEALLTKDDANAYPDFCWKKKVLTNENI